MVSANSNIWYCMCLLQLLQLCSYEAIGPASETMQKDMKNMESASTSLSQKVVTDGLFTWFFHSETQFVYEIRQIKNQASVYSAKSFGIALFFPLRMVAENMLTYTEDTHEENTM